MQPFTENRGLVNNLFEIYTGAPPTRPASGHRRQSPLLPFATLPVP